MRQLFARPQALAVAAAFLAVLTLTGLPLVPLFLDRRRLRRRGGDDFAAREQGIESP